jgi:hypothetical protein
MFTLREHGRHHRALSCPAPKPHPAAGGAAAGGRRHRRHGRLGLRRLDRCGDARWRRLQDPGRGGRPSRCASRSWRTTWSATAPAVDAQLGLLPASGRRLRAAPPTATARRGRLAGLKSVLPIRLAESGLPIGAADGPATPGWPAADRLDGLVPPGPGGPIGRADSSRALAEARRQAGHPAAAGCSRTAARLDPWDVDVIAVVDGFLDQLRQRIEVPQAGGRQPAAATNRTWPRPAKPFWRLSVLGGPQGRSARSRHLPAGAGAG